MTKLGELISFRAIALCGHGLVMSACLSMSSFQTAKTVKPGESRAIIASAFLSGDPLDAFNRLEGHGDRTKGSPQIFLGWRWGLAENLDIGVLLSSAYTLDVKYRVLGSHTSSTDLALGVIGRHIGRRALVGHQYNYVASDFSYPIYLSAELHKSFSVYATPSYTKRRFWDYTAAGTAELIGVNTGVRIGGDFGVFLEYTYMNGLPTKLEQVPGEREFRSQEVAVAFYWH